HGGVVITYVTDDPRLKAFSLGRRGDLGPVGASSLAAGIESCASGIASVAMGCESDACGDFSVALGGGVTASGDCQTVVGRGNVSDRDKAFIVGNGDGPADHIGPASFSNAFAVGWDGSAEVQGALTASGAILKTPLPMASGGTGAATADEARKAIGAAAASHTHAATDIASGTLPVSRGGTGATDAAGARAGLGAAASKHTHSAAGITSGTLSADRLPTVPVSKGGTGATTAAAAFRALSGYTLDLRANNTKGTWIPVINGSTIQHRAIAPVYRLYNEYDRQRLLTASRSEYNSLVKAGWNGEGVAFYAFA
ncbi:hypothetical protein, partial [Tractidigestivibacter sp.]|uniref:hypothetical protein n=1 Tax=Tractidigestivibacter sp. TaxID=2847320 RepID=UPI002A95D2CF|nr:hypothetical protein [Tractidigestivibacter sp.]